MVRKKLSVLLSISLVLNLFLYTLQPAQSIVQANDNGAPVPVLVEDDFNHQQTGSIPAGYTVDEAGGTVRIVDFPSEANKSVYLNNTSSSANVTLSRMFEEQTDAVTVDFKFLQEAMTSATKIMRLLQSGADGDSVAVFLETSGGNLSYRHADDSYTHLQSYTAGVWYDFRVIADLRQQKADVYINGELKISSADFYAPVSAIDKFETFTPNSNTIGHYMDDIKVIAGAWVPGSDQLPEVPAQLQANAGFGHVDLVWSVADSADTYTVKRSTTDGGPYDVIAEGLFETHYTDTDVINGMTYYYVVSAVNHLGESADSEQVSATPTEPQAPARPVVSVEERVSQLSLSWDPADFAESYTVKRSTTDGGPYQVLTSGLSATHYVDSNLDHELTYYYVVTAVNEYGETDSLQVQGTPREPPLWGSTPIGYASLNGGTTGGFGAETYSVYTLSEYWPQSGYDNPGEAMYQLLRNHRNKPNEGLVIYVDLTISENNFGRSKMDVKDVSNVSILGVGTLGEFDGVGFTVSRANNIVFRNLSIHHVRQGEGTAIEITENSHNIWIDHNDFYSEYYGNPDKDYYDGLVDIKRGAEYITVSWNRFHDHWKTALVGHTDNPSLAPDKITYHNNYFHDLESRVPLIRYARVHMLNNYFKNVHDTAINARVGAQVLVEGNYFENVGSGQIDPVTGQIKGPVGWFYGSPTTGYWNLVNNVYVNTPHEHLESTTDFTVPYEYTAVSPEEAKLLAERYTGVGIIDTTDGGENGPPQSNASVTIDSIVIEYIGQEVDTPQLIWHSITFGQSTDLNFASNVLPEKVGTNYANPEVPGTIEGSIILESRGGKLAPGHDGLTFYYTTLDPNVHNFVLEADMIIEQFGPETGAAPNSQDSAGIMVRDVNGSPRQDPMILGFEEVPAASNIFGVGMMRHGISPIYRTGVIFPWGNVGSQLRASAFSGGIGLVLDTPVRVRLERTDTHFIMSATFIDPETNQLRTVEQSVQGADMVQVIDPDQMHVGFYAARNAKMIIQNASITLSEANTQPTPIVEPAPPTPTLSIVSAPQSGAVEYSLKFVANYDGNVSVSQNGTEVLSNEALSANEVFRFHTLLEQDFTNFSVTYIPTEGPSTAPISREIMVEKKIFNSGEGLFVAPDGKGDAAGTIDDPLDLETAIRYVLPGETILMRGGTYTPSATIMIQKQYSGEEGKLKRIVPYNGEKVVLDGRNSVNTILQLDADYWHLYGLQITRAAGTGMRLSGDHNIIEMMVFNYNGNTGFHISGGGTDPDRWPKYNLILNCESHDNRDSANIDADGFAAKLGVGVGNVFRGNIAHHNIDDGWDLYNRTNEGPNMPIVLDGNIAYSNGKLSNGYNQDGNTGVGFKLGGEGLPVAHIVKNNIAFDNNMDGFSDNFNPGGLII